MHVADVSRTQILVVGGSLETVTPRKRYLLHKKIQSSLQTEHYSEVFPAAPVTVLLQRNDDVHITE